MISFRKNKSGFSLIELIVVVSLLIGIGLLSLNTYIKSNVNYQFVSNYKHVISSLRTARLYAFMNKDIDNLSFDNFGVFINQNCIVLFADSGNANLVFEEDNSIIKDDNCLSGNINLELNNDEIENFESTNDYLIEDKTFIFNDLDYTFNIVDEDISLPVIIFYELSTGNVNLFNSNYEEIDKQFLEINFASQDNELNKSIIFYKYSGLSEEKI